MLKIKPIIVNDLCSLGKYDTMEITNCLEEGSIGIHYIP
jgi:hypothetical protein